MPRITRLATTAGQGKPEPAMAPAAAAHQRVGGGIQAADVQPIAEDHASTEETDARGNLGGNPHRTRFMVTHGCDQAEHGSADRHEHVGAQARHLVAPLPLDANDRANYQGRGKP